MSGQITIVELGPRDGLQNEATPIPVETKIELIRRLADAGLTVIEAGAFVSPKWVPQMAGSAEVLSSATSLDGIKLPVLVPNMKGYEAARRAGAETIAVFTSASESFNHRNINCSTEESLTRFSAIATTAKTDGIKIRGYVSNVLGCPYEGDVPVANVIGLSRSLLELGCYEISLCDTIGVGTPGEARELIRTVKQDIPVERLAGHFHDTYGQALANAHAWIEEGVTVFDSSISGLGGCPFAKGASGNLATEDLVYSLQSVGEAVSIDLDALVDTSFWISDRLNRTPSSNVALAFRGRCAA